MKYKATLYNANCAFDSANLTNVNDIKAWAKGRGYSYFLKIEAMYENMPSELVITYNVKNNRFYKV
jgi:hypothetical protein